MPFLLRLVAAEERKRGADLSEKLIVIEPGDPEFSVGLNVLEAQAGQQSYVQLAEFAQILKAHQRIDILVNNAGVRHDALLIFMKPEQWAQVIATNLNSFYYLTSPVVKQMALNRWGRVVTIASTSCQTGVEGQANYAAAKAGVIGASKALAREVAKRGVTVNVVAPGFIETEMLAEAQRAQFLQQIPAGRFGKPEEVAAAAAFLCSDGAAYITGAVLNVNGGVYT